MLPASNKFQGQLPSELGALTALRNLRVEINELTGALPSQFGQLSHLEELFTCTYPHDLYLLLLESRSFLTVRIFLCCDLPASNVITSSIPTEFGFLTSLKFLEIDRNKLEGTSTY